MNVGICPTVLFSNYSDFMHLDPRLLAFVYNCPLGFLPDLRKCSNHFTTFCPLNFFQNKYVTFTGT